MNDIDKTKEELLLELADIRRENANLRFIHLNEAKDDINLEVALTKSKEQYSALIKAIPDLLFVQNKEGEFIYFHAPETSSLYAEPEDFLGKKMDEVLPANLVEKIREVYQNALITNKLQMFEYAMELRDGIHYYESRIKTFDDGESFSIIRDITQSKQQEMELIKLKKAIAELKDVVFMTNKEGIFTFINPAFTNMYGFTHGEVIGKVTPRILKSGLSSMEFIKYLWNALMSKERVFGEYINATKEGKFINIEGSADPILDDDGEIIGFLGIHRDITERKKIEETLRESENRFRTVVSNSPLVSFVINDKGIFTLSEGKGLAKIGLEAGQVVGMSVFEIYRDYPMIINAVQNSLAGFEQRCELKIQDVVFETLFSPVIDDNGHVRQIIGVANDTTERKKAEEEIQFLNTELEKRVEERTLELQNMMEKMNDANIELQSLNEQVMIDSNRILNLNEELLESQKKLTDAIAIKDKFFSIIAHDLRNPAAAIYMNLELLVKYYDRFEEIEFREKIGKLFDTSIYLKELIDNLLQWSGIQTNRFEFMPKQFLLNILIESNILLYKINATDKKINISFKSIHKDIYLIADYNMINTIIRNLLSNAIKFTPEGGEIEIGAINSKLSDDLKSSENSNKIQIYVKDSGVGMPPEILNKLFKIEENVTNKGTSGESGTGLGLILCKEFVEKHGGKIWVESEVGKGSTFWFSLPMNNV